MEFTPKAPREDVNYSQTHPLKEVSSLLFVSILAILLIVGSVAWFSDIVVHWISPEKELELFQGLLPEILASVSAEHAFVDTPDLVREVFDRVVQAGPPLPYGFQLKILCDDTPNALAVPGGAILVTSGLLKALRTEGELAFVLGHELGHFMHRDHLQGLGRGVLIQLVFGIIFGAVQVDPSVALEIAIAGASRAYDRDQESAADGVGAEILYGYEGHVGAAMGAMEILKDAAEEGALEKMDFLRTHPVGDRRISDLKALANERAWSLDAESKSLGGDFAALCAESLKP
jgi:Zn-dependent protease with chaperone function